MRWVRQLGRARQLGEASCLASAGRVTRVGETTFSHVNKRFGSPTRTVGPVLSLLQCAFVLPCRQIFIAFQCGLSCQEFLLGTDVLVHFLNVKTQLYLIKDELQRNKGDVYFVFKCMHT